MTLEDFSIIIVGGAALRRETRRTHNQRKQKGDKTERTPNSKRKAGHQGDT